MYVDPLGDFPRPSLQQISDFSAGFGDTITFGLTARARVALGAEGVVQHNSKAYGGGTVTGFAAGAAVTGGFGAGAARIAAGGGARGLAAAGALVSGSNYAMNRAAIGATICPTNLTLALAAGAAAPGLATAGGRIASRLGPTASTAAETGTATNKIYSARVLQRMGEEPGPMHNFPGSFDNTVFKDGARSSTSDFFSKAKPNLSSDSIQYRLSGNINGKAGRFEIFTRPSTSGRSEMIMHRFFRPDS